MMFVLFRVGCLWPGGADNIYNTPGILYRMLILCTMGAMVVLSVGCSWARGADSGRSWLAATPGPEEQRVEASTKAQPVHLGAAKRGETHLFLSFVSNIDQSPFVLRIQANPFAVHLLFPTSILLSFGVRFQDRSLAFLCFVPTSIGRLSYFVSNLDPLVFHLSFSDIDRPPSFTRSILLSFVFRFQGRSVCPSSFVSNIDPFAFRLSFPSSIPSSFVFRFQVRSFCRRHWSFCLSCLSYLISIFVSALALCRWKRFSWRLWRK